MSERDQDGYWVGDFGGHLWKDDRGPDSHCARCDLLYARWSGDACHHAATESEVIQRLTLECAHLRLEGPWQPTENGRTRHMIGDISWCELCPRAEELDRLGPGDTRKVYALRQIVNVENLPADLYREPDEKANNARREQRYG